MTSFLEAWRGRRRHRFGSESDVYVVLVAELFSGAWPVAIMGAMFVGVGLYIAYCDTNRWLAAATLAGGGFQAAKLWLVFLQRRERDPALWNRQDAARWEGAQAIVNLGFASTLSVVTTWTFALLPPIQSILATGLAFGYGSGVAARMAVRPRLAISLLCIVTVPAIVATAWHGSTYLVLSVFFAFILMGSIETVVRSHQAISRQIAMRLDMAILARRDPLTGLANRLGLHEAFRELVNSAKAGPMIAVHCFDLDAFKPVNDRHGHPTGDSLLRMLAARMAAMLRDGDFAARIGGDEFVIIQASVHHPDEAATFSRLLSKALSAPYLIDGHMIQIGVSMGHVTSTTGAQRLEELVSAADVAVYRIKNAKGLVAGPVLPPGAGHEGARGRTW